MRDWSSDVCSSDLHAAHVIDDRVVFYFVEQSVDGQIATEGVFVKRAKGVVGSQNVALAVFGAFAVGM